MNLKGSKDFATGRALRWSVWAGKPEAEAIFSALVADGEAAVVTQHVNFYGAEGTTGVTVDIINSAAYYTQALGHLGLGHRGKAKRLFAEVQRLKPDHLWANEFMKQFEK